MKSRDLDHSDTVPLAPIGSVIAGRYLVEEALGQGAYGSVYLVRDGRLGIRAAMKLFPAEILNDDRATKQLVREIRACFRVTSPHTARFFDIVRTPALLGYTMEWVDGQNLQQILDSTALSPTQILSLLSQIAIGLEAIHSVGVVHRDLKPANIVVTSDGIAKITDFGLARLTSGLQAGDQFEESGTSNLIAGTPLYISPECIRGEEVDGRSDLYALGTIGFEMVYRRAAYEARSIIELLQMKGYVPVQFPDTIQVDPRLRSILEKLLALAPAQRPRSAAQLIPMLQALWQESMRGEEQAACSVRIAEPHWRPRLPFLGALFVSLLYQCGIAIGNLAKGGLGINFYTRSRNRYGMLEGGISAVEIVGALVLMALFVAIPVIQRRNVEPPSKHEVVVPAANPGRNDTRHRSVRDSKVSSTQGEKSRMQRLGAQ